MYAIAVMHPGKRSVRYWLSEGSSGRVLLYPSYTAAVAAFVRLALDNRRFQIQPYGRHEA